MTEEQKVNSGEKTILLARLALAAISFFKEFFAIFGTLYLQYYKTKAARAETALAKLKMEDTINEAVSKIESSKSADPRDGIDNFLRKN
jgi:hypothetical protein